jgi:hypothetical protein
VKGASVVVYASTGMCFTPIFSAIVTAIRSRCSFRPKSGGGDVEAYPHELIAHYILKKEKVRTCQRRSGFSLTHSSHPNPLKSKSRSPGLSRRSTTRAALLIPPNCCRLHTLNNQQKKSSNSSNGSSLMGPWPNTWSKHLESVRTYLLKIQPFTNTQQV